MRVPMLNPDQVQSGQVTLRQAGGQGTRNETLPPQPQKRLQPVTIGLHVDRTGDGIRTLIRGMVANLAQPVFGNDPMIRAWPRANVAWLLPAPITREAAGRR